MAQLRGSASARQPHENVQTQFVTRFKLLEQADTDIFGHKRAQTHTHTYSRSKSTKALR